MDTAAKVKLTIVRPDRRREAKAARRRAQGPQFDAAAGPGRCAASPLLWLGVA